MTELLGGDDPAPVEVVHAAASGPFLLISDHAGNRVPRRLAMLGLPQAELDRHIGIDIGIDGVGRGLSRRLDATLIQQRYSRLVIDCNRPPTGPEAIVARSDGTDVPGNIGLPAADRALRVRAIFEPYHACITDEIDRRVARHRPPVLIALHSFTPRHGDLPAPRPWHVGVLWNRDDRLARRLVEVLRQQGDLCVGLNEPYAVTDSGDYAIPVHAERRGLLHVELEIRQDLIEDAAGQDSWAARLARALPAAMEGLDHPGPAVQG